MSTKSVSAMSVSASESLDESVIEDNPNCSVELSLFKLSADVVKLDFLFSSKNCFQNAEKCFSNLGDDVDILI